MAATDRNPVNPNFLQPNKYVLNFGRLPNMAYFCQSVSVPGISMSETPQSTPFVDIFAPGDKAIYDIFNVTFLIDERMGSWIEVHDWIRAMTFPEDFEDYKGLSRLNKAATLTQTKTPQYSDATLTVLSSSNIPYVKIHFRDAFPTTLSTFIMSAGSGPDELLTADATFRYTYYDIEKLY
jgi:hypothetical protein|tara:strand:- start:628 stop:1167 length:540 start_codon:yes stop_codon:yes gene_type:complete